MDPLKEMETNTLIFASTNKNKEILKKYTKLWDEIKKLISRIDDKPGEYGKDFMKIKFIICL